MRRLALLVLGLACSAGAYALHRLDARADEAPVPRVLINDAGYAYLEYRGPDLRGCVCCAMVPEAGVHCHCPNDAGAWAEVRVP